MIGKLFLWFSTGALDALGDQLNNAYRAKLNALNNKDRIEADKQIAILNARQAVLITEQRTAITRWIRPAFAFPFIIYNAKIILWDKVFGFGTTEPLSAEYWQLQMIVFGAYFLTRPLERNWPNTKWNR